MSSSRLIVAWLTALLVCLVEAPAAPAQPPEASRKTRRVVLVTADGLRVEEFFGGLDPILLEDRKKSGVEDLDRLRQQYWRSTPKERREALMPFFWKTLAPRGVVLGNKTLGSRVQLTNPHRVSFPGYAELLTGQAQAAITGNAPVRIPRPTILEFVRHEFDLERTGVALFGSWARFEHIASHEEDAVFSNAGYVRMPPDLCNPAMTAWSDLQMRMMTPWDTVRHDAVTTGLALEYLKKYRPRLLYLALGETDDWAHDRRYDRVVHGIRLFDDALRELWATLQSMDEYRDRTSLVLTTDHGRGVTADDWTDHGGKIPAAADIWVAVIGPDTPDRGEVGPTPTFHLDNVAATVLDLFGLEAKKFNPEAGKAIPLAFEQN